MLSQNGWSGIDQVSWRYDKGTQAVITVVKGSGPVDWEEAKGRFGLAMSYGGFTPPYERKRPGRRHEGAPFNSSMDYSFHAVSVRLPEGTDP